MKKRLQKWDESKRLIRLHRRDRSLNSLNRDDEWVDLETPILAGWKRFYVLRKDIAASNNGAMYKRILDMINTEVICNRKDFKRKDYKTKKMVDIPQRTRRFTKPQFAKLKLSEKERTLFEYRRLPTLGGKYYRAFVYKYDWQFELKIRRHVITQRRIINTELEQEIAEVQNELYSFSNRVKLAKTMGWSFDYYYRESDRYKAPKHKKKYWEELINT